MTQNTSPATSSFKSLGVTVSVLTEIPEELYKAEVILHEELAELDRTCSRFRDDSELSLLCQSSGERRPISPLLCELLIVAIDVALLTDGAVDPTIGSALSRIGYDRDFDQIVREGDAIDSDPLPAPGWQLLEVDAVHCSAQIPAGIVVDLGATAKAFGADRAAHRIAHVIDGGVLVNLGGDIAIAGTPVADGWHVGITDNSSTHPDATDVVVDVRSGGLATSGTGVRRWQRGDQTLHHIIDPTTGNSATDYWRLVSVAANSCVRANAASTAAIVKAEGAIAWLESMCLPARLVSSGGQVFTIGGWPPDRAPTKALER